MNKFEKNDELDLIDILNLFWIDKWKIMFSVAITTLVGFIFLNFQKSEFESKIGFKVESIPPFYDHKKASEDFERFFYSIKNFKEWKLNNNSTEMEFQNISETVIIDGFVLFKDEKKRLAFLTSDKKGKHILVKSNNLNLLKDCFDYATFVSDLLKEDYLLRSQQELNIIETRFKDFSTANDAIITKLLAVDRYIAAVNKGYKVIGIFYPTLPKQTSPRPVFTMALFLLIGLLAGIIYVSFRNFRKPD